MSGPQHGQSSSEASVGDDGHTSSACGNKGNGWGPDPGEGAEKLGCREQLYGQSR